MTGLSSYDLVLNLLKGKKAENDRVPCLQLSSPATAEFMTHFDVFWPDANRDPEKMAKVAAAAHRIAGLDSISLPFDIPLFASIYGIIEDLRVDAAKRGKYLYPGVKTPGLRMDGITIKTPDDLQTPLNVGESGRVKVLLNAVKILHEEFYGKVPVIVQVMDPFTLVPGYLADPISFFTYYKTKPDLVRAFIEKVKEPLNITLPKLLKESGADVFDFHVGGISCDVLSPQSFDVFVKPYLIDVIAKMNHPTFIDSCGSSLPIVKELINTGANALRLDEKTDIKKAKEIIDQNKPGFPLGGNLAPRTILHRGPPDKIREMVKFLVEDVKVDFVAPGCDLWIETPAAHIKAMADATREFTAKA